MSARRLARAPLLPVAVLVGATPVCLWLAGQVNTGGFEIAAALWLWTAALVLVRAPAVTRAMVRDVGLAFVLLVTCRGLSPLFGPLALVAVALVADPPRLRALARRRDVRWWGIGSALALGASVAWLAYIQLRYPLDDRPGTGVGSALGTWDFYLRQTVGVFGVNDVVVPLPAVVAWGAVAAVVVVVGLVGSTGRTRAVAVAVAVGGFALNVTAEGLSLPPIGYYWQGRYVLPVLVGVAVLASGPPTRPVPSALARLASPWALAGVLVALHVWALAFAARHFAGRGRGDVGYLDAVRAPAWSAALLPGWAWVLLAGGAVAGAAAVALGPARPLGGRPDDPSPSVAALDQSSDLRGA